MATTRRALERPLSLDEAAARIASWFEQPCVGLIHATEHHWMVFQELLKEGQASGNLVTDAHLAALAIEHGCELASTDADFSRFPRVKWTNPLKRKA